VRRAYERALPDKQPRHQSTPTNGVAPYEPVTSVEASFDDPDLVADGGLSTPELPKRPGPFGPDLFAFAAANELCARCARAAVR